MQESELENSFDQLFVNYGRNEYADEAGDVEFEYEAYGEFKQTQVNGRGFQTRIYAGAHKLGYFSGCKPDVEQLVYEHSDEGTYDDDDDYMNGVFHLRKPVL